MLKGGLGNLDLKKEMEFLRVNDQSTQSLDQPWKRIEEPIDEITLRTKKSDSPKFLDEPKIVS
jgi:hypothetical protein